MSNTESKRDVVEDGGIKCKIPGLSKMFASCSAGEPPKPSAGPANKAADLVNDGGIGDGMAAQAGKAIMNRQQQLDAQIAKMGG
ncbi:MAG: hypothetical protein HYS17_10510 [Micavibrio aeruginosavorus]|uniref:Uncharacterized protein n=1 Tax=Micavibrio aeruginosavorus TaxID=349221 RepID=A0A7T5R1P2_9BACT|nr:MAG: hypothetical protein HYS17_10510 [Micavibrio aeruginosavorus]